MTTVTSSDTALNVTAVIGYESGCGEIGRLSLTAVPFGAPFHDRNLD